MYILIILIFALFLAQFILATILAVRAENKSEKNGIFIDAVSIIIPLKNEAHRISNLISSINAQRFPTEKFEFIFVDDHSNDHSKNIIHNELRVPFRYLLNNGSGKKQAIRTGVQNAEFDFILTLDADVSLPNGYLNQILKTYSADLIILPVAMTGDKFIQDLGAIEFNWLQQLTFGSFKPTLCNGANLLFRKSSYQHCEMIRTDYDLPSGDDVFLMEAMQKKGFQVNRNNLSDLTVKTEAPKSFNKLLQQRKRWLSKINRMKNSSNLVAGFFLILIQLSFFVALFLAFYFPIVWLAILFKFLAELFLLKDSEQKNRHTFFIALYVHQFWYPFYLVQLLFYPKSNTDW